MVRRWRADSAERVLLETSFSSESSELVAACSLIGDSHPVIVVQ